MYQIIYIYVNIFVSFLAVLQAPLRLINSATDLLNVTNFTPHVLMREKNYA